MAGEEEEDEDEEEEKEKELFLAEVVGEATTVSLFLLGEVRDFIDEAMMAACRAAFCFSTSKDSRVGAGKEAGGPYGGSGEGHPSWVYVRHGNGLDRRSSSLDRRSRILDIDNHVTDASDAHLGLAILPVVCCYGWRGRRRRRGRNF